MFGKTTQRGLRVKSTKHEGNIAFKTCTTNMAYKENILIVVKPFCFTDKMSVVDSYTLKTCTR